MPEILRTLTRYPVARTVDVEEARKVHSMMYESRVDVEPTERGEKFEFHVNRVPLDTIQISTAWFRSGTRLRSDLVADAFLLMIARKGKGLVWCPQREVSLECGRSGAVLSPPERGMHVMDANYYTMTIAIQRSDLDSAAESLLGLPLRQPLRFEPALPLDSGIGSSLLRTAEFCIEDLEREEGALRYPLIRAQLADTLKLGLLLGHSHTYSGKLQSRLVSLEPRYVHQVEEYLDANAGEPISMTDLSRLTGASIRTIQAAFKRYRGYTPIQFRQMRRLELARKRLLCARSGTTVTQIALECGFENFGRFSRAYRARFGELPSATHRRSR